MSAFRCTVGHTVIRRSLSAWEQWRTGKCKQLDHFHDLKMYREPVKRPPGAIVLRPHWQCSIKRDGMRRPRNGCDGSPRSAPLLHGIASTCSSCVEQPVQCLFFALVARENHRVHGGDAQDAYAHSPPPETPTFVSIDDAYADWYEHWFKKKLDRSLVLPVLHALQGHPKSCKLWEKHITAILQSPAFGFKSTIHDKSICSATFEGTKILLLRQVDDFDVACPSEDIAKRLCAQIGKALQLPSEDAPPFKCLGLIKDFNGLDVAQHSDAIKLSCEKYIDRVLTTHGWSKPSPPVPSKPSAPLPVDSVTSVCAHPGPPENTAEHAALVAKYGFACRTLLGELFSCMPMLRVGQTLATLPLHYLSSPLARMTITLLCSRRSPNTSELLKTGASHAVGPNQIHLFPLPTSPSPQWIPSYLIFPLWTPRNPLHFSMLRMPMICVTADPLPATPSCCAAVPFPTDARRNLSPLRAPPKRNFSPPLPPQSMLDACAQS